MDSHPRHPRRVMEEKSHHPQHPRISTEEKGHRLQCPWRHRSVDHCPQCLRRHRCVVHHPQCLRRHRSVGRHPLHPRIHRKVKHHRQTPWRHRKAGFAASPAVLDSDDSSVEQDLADQNSATLLAGLDLAASSASEWSASPLVSEVSTASLVRKVSTAHPLCYWKDAAEVWWIWSGSDSGHYCSGDEEDQQIALLPLMTTREKQ